MKSELFCSGDTGSGVRESAATEIAGARPRAGRQPHRRRARPARRASRQAQLRRTQRQRASTVR